MSVKRSAIAVLAHVVALAAIAPVAGATPLAFIRGPNGLLDEPTIAPPPRFNGIPIGGPLITRAADLRGNGRPDLLIGIGVNPTQPTRMAFPLRVARPNAAGTGLVDVTRQVFGSGALPANEHPREMALADFNGDGVVDMFVAAHGYDTFPYDGERNSLVQSNGDGTWSNLAARLPQAPDFTHCVAVADVDGDGLLDIYVGNVSAAPPPYFLMGRAGGGLVQRSSNLPAAVLDVRPEYRWHACLLPDLDGDGAPDLVLGSGYNGDSPSLQTVVFFNDGHGDFTRRALVRLPNGPFGDTATVDDIVAMDVNGDGRMDLLVLSTQSGAKQDLGMAIQVLVNQGGGVFTDESFARLGASASRTTGFWWTFLDTADIDGDGRLDFYGKGYPQPGLDVPMIWLNNGDGTFSAQNTSVLPDPSGGLEAIDVDGDGRLDFVSMYYENEPDKFAWQSWLNRTPRTAPSEPVVSALIGGDRAATLVFKPPLGVGPLPVTGYAAACRAIRDGQVRTASGASSPLTVSGLVNGADYDCTVRATTSGASGLPSGARRVRTGSGLHRVLEFYNSELDHFFITANPAEQIVVAGGAAGAWSQSGSFPAGGAVQVCRFYGSVSPGPNSHFYTIDPAECQGLKDLQATTPASAKRWNFESNDFAAATAPGRQCAAGTAPIYRAYNNGFGSGIDSNHRITADAAAYQSRLDRGWTGEGIVMCVPL